MSLYYVFLYFFAKNDCEFPCRSEAANLLLWLFTRFLQNLVWVDVIVYVFWPVALTTTIKEIFCFRHADPQVASVSQRNLTTANQLLAEKPKIDMNYLSLGLIEEESEDEVSFVSAREFPIQTMLYSREFSQPTAFTERNHYRPKSEELVFSERPKSL